MLANSFLARDVDLWELASEMLRIPHLSLTLLLTQGNPARTVSIDLSPAQILALLEKVKPVMPPFEPSRHVTSTCHQREM